MTTQRSAFMTVLRNWRKERLAQVDMLVDGPDKSRARQAVEDTYNEWLAAYNGASPDDRTVRDLITESHATAVEKGWWEDRERNMYEQLFLMHTELSEAGEELRDGHKISDTYYNLNRTVETPDGGLLAKPEGFLAELVDVLIRIGDTVGRYGLTDNFLLVLEEKLRYNKYRPYRHGGKTA